jgi:outer membrane receptor for ferrienterochelin and colicin
MVWLMATALISAHYINADNSYTTGLELTNKMPVTKWWDLTLNVNIFYSQINAVTPATATTLNNQPQQFIGKLVW